MSVDNAASAKTCDWFLASLESFVDERNELRRAPHVTVFSIAMQKDYRVALAGD